MGLPDQKRPPVLQLSVFLIIFVYDQYNGYMKAFLFIMSFVVCVTLVSAQMREPGEEKIIRDVLSRQELAWNNFNIEQFMDGYWNSDSLMFLGSKGINYGWKVTLDRYKKTYPDQQAMGKLKFEVLQMTPLSKDSYFLTGRYRLSRTMGDVEGMFTLIFRKIKGRWVIVYDHTS